MIEKDSLPIPPDGGWGWVIVFASHCINVIVDGVCFTYGLFLDDIQTYFDASLAKTALVGSLVPGLYLGMGPIASALANKFGVRIISIAGAIMASMGFFTCVYSPSIDWLIFFYGIIGGIGFGLLYLPSIVIVNFYFDKRRATASGLAVCGSGMGTLIFTFITQPLLDTFSWKGSMWIIAGIVLNGCVLASLFRPLSAPQPCKPKNENKDDYPTSFIMRKIKEQKERQRTFSTGSTDGMIITNDNKLIQDKDFKKIIAKKQKALRKASSISLRESHKLDPFRDRLTVADASRPLYRQDIFFTGSLHSIKEYKSQPDMRTYIASVTSIPQDSKTGAFAPIICAAKNMFGVALFKSLTFNLVCLTAWLYMMGFFVPFAYSPSFAKEECGVDDAYTKIPLLVMGGCNTVGRIISGWLSDQPWANSMILHNAALFLAGLSTMIIPFIKNFIVLNIYAAFYGFCVATFISLRSIVLVDLLGVQRLTNAFGILLLFQGIAVVFGTPVGGAIKDKTGSYTIVYMYAGTTLLISSIIGIIAKFVADKENKTNGNFDIVEADNTSCLHSVPSIPNLNKLT